MLKKVFLTSHPADLTLKNQVAILKDNQQLCCKCVKLFKIPDDKIIRIEKGFCIQCQFSAH